MAETRHQPLALVTGASSGIGKATAMTLAKAGYKIIVHGRSGARCAQVVEAIEAPGAVLFRPR